MSGRAPLVIRSALSRTIEEDGVSIELKIYRSESQAPWSMEVLCEDGTSTIWEDTFATDEIAERVFLETLANEGVSTFLDDSCPPTLH